MALDEHRVARGLRRIANRFRPKERTGHGQVGGKRRPLRVLVVGHSHIECLRAAADARPEPSQVSFLNLRQLQATVDTPKGLPAAIASEIARVAPDALCLCLAGNVHNLIGLIENPVPFAIGAVDAGAIPPSPTKRHFIPSAMMREQIESSMSANLVAKIFSMRPDSTKMILEPPPPISDFEHVRRFPGAFKDKLEMGPAPRELRLALYRMQSDILRELAERETATFVAVDPESVDGDGFLRPAYFSRDPTHGNAAYGDIMLSKIIRLTEGSE
ncbi:hypothetical protein MLD63_04035 [Paracoccus sp. TK19116]|uniref:SGNH/GDSL hydrolase family protein n=1 Tax=Paracoccus albicereus TaxID=2922394 RepID=A0ABT1MMU6_9RHOB|nr:hypothetical protein [Paracoccus albicereus]MCQ0969599.1 hypothetical protein [Paracoccus albicereus]